MSDDSPNYRRKNSGRWRPFDEDKDEDQVDMPHEMLRNENSQRQVTASEVETYTESSNHTPGRIAAYAGVALFLSFREHFFLLVL